jgi:uncharacterized Zn finger protein (UPF0148 family)
MKAMVASRTAGEVYCPICTHRVAAELDLRGKRARVAAGERCPRCQAPLEVAVIVQIPEAA